MRGQILAVMWILFGAFIGAGACWYTVRDMKRPVIELRIGRQDTLSTATPSTP